MLIRSPSRLLSFALLAFVPFAACECETVGTIPEPDLEVADEAGNRHPAADPWLKVAFGDVDDGTTKLHKLALNNVGRAQLEIGNVCLVSASTAEEASGDAAPCVQLSETAFSFPNITGETVAASGTLELPITFAPQQGGPADLFLRIESNDDAEPVVAVQLTGRGTAGQLCADNPVLDFGEVFIGESKTMQVTLDNCGLRPVTIDTYALTSPDDAFSVLVAGVAPAAPIGPLEPGDSITLDVTFTPPEVRSYRDTLAGQANLTTASPFVAAYTLLFVGDGKSPPSCKVNVVPQMVQFGAVASSTTATQQLVIQSVGECACELTSIAGPDPADVGFSMPTPPTLPMTLKGTQGCDGDPAGAQDQPNLVIIDLAYTAPERDTPTVDNATMTVTTTDAVEPVREVSLEANGGGTPFCQIQVTPQGSGSFVPAQGRYGVVQFGRVTVHFTKKLPIELKNIGNTSCTIDGVEWDVEENTLANEFGLEHEDGTPVAVGSAALVTLQPGQTQRYMAVFSPTETIQSDNPLDVFSFGSYSGSLSSFGCGFTGPNTRCNGVKFLTSDTTTANDEEGGIVDGDFSIGFSATPVEPAIDVIPGEIDFGLVTQGCGSPLRRVNVYNTGSGDLIVGQPYAAPDTTPATFEVAANAPSFPHTIPPGGMMAIDVRFYAHTLTVVTGELIIPTQEGGQEGPPVSVPLRGEGTLLTEQTDIFDQFTDPKVDVLWVVDDSGSMAPYQDLLASNFPEFFVESDVSAADYHIAVTTTLALDDACIPDFSGGTSSCNEDEMSGYYTACNGNDRFLTPASSNPEGQFICDVKVSDAANVNPDRSASDAAEAGLQAARNFLQPPNIDDPNINGGFLRDDAKLHVIIVSDEPDFSEGPIDLYVDFFRNLKGFRNDSLVAVSAIAGPPNGCSWTDSGGNTVTVGADARYSDAVTALNGRFQSICEADWTTMMSNLGLASLGLKVEFFLSRAADAATLTVCVRDGSPSATCAPVSQTSDGAANGYFYDPSANSIVFNPGSVPARGSRVEVHYETYCY